MKTTNTLTAIALAVGMAGCGTDHVTVDPPGPQYEEGRLEFVEDVVYFDTTYSGFCVLGYDGLCRPAITVWVHETHPLFADSECQDRLYDFNGEVDSWANISGTEDMVTLKGEHDGLVWSQEGGSCVQSEVGSDRHLIEASSVVTESNLAFLEGAR